MILRMFDEIFLDRNRILFGNHNTTECGFVMIYIYFDHPIYFNIFSLRTFGIMCIKDTLY